MLEIIETEPAHSFQARLAQFFAVIRQPLCLQLGKVIASFPQWNAVCQEVPDLDLEIVRSGGLVLFAGDEDPMNKVRVYDRILAGLIQGLDRLA